MSAYTKQKVEAPIVPPIEPQIEGDIHYNETQLKSLCSDIKQKYDLIATLIETDCNSFTVSDDFMLQLINCCYAVLYSVIWAILVGHIIDEHNAATNRSSSNPLSYKTSLHSMISDTIDI